ncbi:MAG: hypothetical protein QM579_00415 [Desulfovibrio sp.]|uniref:hypothetical protein n=1 Tax=Desulfovibrio sp. TaxID=885 RepID=UPI0039E4570B
MYDTNSTGRKNAGQHSGHGFGRCGRRAATECMPTDETRQEEMPQNGMGQNSMRMRHGHQHGACRGMGHVMGHGMGQGNQNEGRGPEQGCRQAHGRGHGHGMCRDRNMNSDPACATNDDAN